MSSGGQQSHQLWPAHAAFPTPTRLRPHFDFLPCCSSSHQSFPPCPKDFMATGWGALQEKALLPLHDPAQQSGIWITPTKRFFICSVHVSSPWEMTSRQGTLRRKSRDGFYGGAESIACLAGGTCAGVRCCLQSTGKHIVLSVLLRVPRWHRRYPRHHLLSQFIPFSFSVIFSQPLVLSVL